MNLLEKKDYFARIEDTKKIYSHRIKTRIRYSETDRMGYCYYGNYAQFFEMGRVELLRSLGIAYKSLEDSGIMLPVSNFQINYIKPILYDEEITIKTHLRAIPTAKIIFDYEIFSESGALTSTGETTLVFVNAKNMKPTRAPQPLLDKLSNLE